MYLPPMYTGNAHPIIVHRLIAYPYDTVYFINYASLHRATNNIKGVKQERPNVNEATALNLEVLQQQLDTVVFGQVGRLRYVSIIDSTNTAAMKLAQEGRAEEGCVILTDSQTAGRGRLGRPWIDTFGYNVLSSTILKPHFPLALLVMIASLAVVDAIADVCKVTATIKWPNDVLLDEQKVAGILIETTRDSAGQMIAVMGIGINVSRPPVQIEVAQDLTRKAITLEAVCGRRVSREALIARLLKHIETSYNLLQQETLPSVTSGTASMDVGGNWGPASRRIRERWRSRLATLGRTIEVRQGDAVLSGVAEDVDDNGELLLRRHSGERVSITWGDVGYPTA